MTKKAKCMGLCMRREEEDEMSDGNVQLHVGQYAWTARGTGIAAQY
jgi:hypothetical protein